MRVLHIGKYYFPFHGGIENFTRDLVESPAYNDEVETMLIVHHHETGKVTEQVRINGVLVKKVRCQGVLLYAPICLTFLKELSQAIDEYKPDIIHIHMPNLSAFVCLFSSKAKKIPWIIHWHSDVLGAAPDWRIKVAYNVYASFERQLLRKAKAIIATSPSYLADSKPLANFLDKCHTIPLGIRTGFSSSIANRINEEFDGLKLLIIGRLTYYKGHALLLQALSQIEKAHLTVIGDGELKFELQSDIKNLGLENRVSMLGKVSANKLEQELLNCDLLCLPSIEKTEAFGMVLLEAMRAQKPCLVSDVKGSGMSWVVQDNITGFVVKHNSVELLVDKLEYINRNKSLLTEYGKAGVKRFGELFDIKEVASKITSLYLNVVRAK